MQVKKLKIDIKGLNGNCRVKWNEVLSILEKLVKIFVLVKNCF